VLGRELARLDITTLTLKMLLYEHQRRSAGVHSPPPPYVALIRVTEEAEARRVGQYGQLADDAVPQRHQLAGQVYQHHIGLVYSAASANQCRPLVSISLFQLPPIRQMHRTLRFCGRGAHQVSFAEG